MSHKEQVQAALDAIRDSKADADWALEYLAESVAIAATMERSEQKLAQLQRLLAMFLSYQKEEELNPYHFWTKFPLQ